MSLPETECYTPLPDWARVHKPAAHGMIKLQPEDFQVTEVLGFEPDGAGEHLFLYIEKRGLNTQELVNTIARQLSIKAANIAYSGLKDRHAVTRQWLSVWHPAKINTDLLKSDQFRVLKSARHHSKLKRGSHRANHFQITVNQLSHIDEVEAAIERVRRQGVPNYFGLQRFGRDGRNIDKAAAMFSGNKRVDRHQRGLYLSAVRSFLFNQVLSERVEQGSWNRALEGEVLTLAGSQSFFHAPTVDAVLLQRLAEFDVHPSSPMWGKGEFKTTAAAHELESAVVEQYPALLAGLLEFGLRQQRRANRLVAEGLVFERLAEDRLRLEFSLTRGSFATVVLRELLDFRA